MKKYLKIISVLLALTGATSATVAAEEDIPTLLQTDVSLSEQVLNNDSMLVQSEADVLLMNEAELSVLGYRFMMMGDVVSTDLNSVPYGADTVIIDFDDEIELDGIQDNISLKTADGTDVETEISVNKKSIEILLNDYLLDRNSSYIICIKAGITAISGSMLANDINTEFITDDKVVSVVTDRYFNEDFNNYVSAGKGTTFPDGWYRLSASGHISLTDMYSNIGSSGEADDTSIRFGATTVLYQRIMKAFDNAVPNGKTVYVDFDVYRGGLGGFYFNLIPECDLEYDKTIHGTGGDHTVDANLTIGMHPCSTYYTPNTSRSTAPNLGYPKAKATSSSLTPFINKSFPETDENYHCNIYPGSWHRVHMKVEPVSKNETILTVSVDGGTEFVQSTLLDYVTNKIAGVAIFAMPPSETSSKLQETQDIRFDNISIYSKADVKIPEVKKVTALDYKGNIQEISTPISSISSCIDLEFDTSVAAESVYDNVRLMCGNKEIECDKQLIESDTVLRFMTKGLLEPDSSYSIVIGENIASAYSARMVNKESNALYFRTLGDGVSKVLSGNVIKDGENLTFSTDIIKTNDQAVKYAVIIAEYETKTKTIGEETVTADELVGVNYQIEEIGSGERGAFTKTVSVPYNAQSNKAVGCVIEIPGNKCVFKAELNEN